MNIQPISQTSFQGYDARPLKGFIIGNNQAQIAREMQEIGKKEGFKIFGTSNFNFVYQCYEGLPHTSASTIWAQDLWTIVSNSLLTHRIDGFSEAIKNFFSLKDNFTQKIIRETPKYQQLCRTTYEETAFHTDKSKDIFQNNLELITLQEKAHIPGGNIFIVKGENGDEAIVGKNVMETFEPEDIESMYHVNKVTVLPQMDFHIDLFIRPLDKKQILIADDNLTLKTLQNIYDKLNENPKENKTAIKKTKYAIKEFKLNVKISDLPKIEETVKILEEAGYKPIRVPGRIYNVDTIYSTTGEDLPQHYCNYMNANVLKNKNGNLVYITNKSDIDDRLGLTPKIIQETGCSFEKAFVDSISPYIDKNHIYFVSGNKNFMSKLLTKYQGGIHCICSEVPFNDKNPEN